MHRAREALGEVKLEDLGLEVCGEHG